MVSVIQQSAVHLKGKDTAGLGVYLTIAEHMQVQGQVCVL